MVRQAVRQAHGPEHSRRIHHPELSRRVISKLEFPMVQTSFEFNPLYFEIYLKFVFCYLGFNKYLQKDNLSSGDGFHRGEILYFFNFRHRVVRLMLRASAVLPLFQLYFCSMSIIISFSLMLPASIDSGFVSTESVGAIPF